MVLRTGLDATEKRKISSLPENRTTNLQPSQYRLSYPGCLILWKGRGNKMLIIFGPRNENVTGGRTELRNEEL
jgi:hypothetical protein